ncbi:phenylalanine--tRNA ligase subunit beta [bacterium]|nr:phenylalanine--tRNA ligase subunit beta [bacterium]
MKISKAWLCDFVDISDLSHAEFETIVTTKVAEVDSIEEIGLGLDTAVVVEILATKAHPQANKLQIATVTDGKTQYEVVCGAPNCRSGLTTAFLPIGSTIESTDGKIKIEQRELRGVTSFGMLASEAELGISSDHAGILELDLKVGQKLREVYGASDAIIEIDNKSLTHRPDLWSHFGFARELSAILKRPLKSDYDQFATSPELVTKYIAQFAKGKTDFQIKIDANTECRRFTAIEITGLDSRKSPAWLRRRLTSIGANPKSLLIDLSNYVMFDLGQPNHTYDADRLSGKVLQIRNAEPGEKFAGLDGETRALNPQEVVVADENGCQCLGGVLGGALSSISDVTTRVLLETENWNPTRVRRTMKHTGIRTDSSNRFEKDQSAESVVLGTVRYLELLNQCGVKFEVRGELLDVYPIKQQVVSIPYAPVKIRELLGAEISDPEIAEILTALSFKIERETITVPYYRATKDVGILYDLVEEVGRIYGYERIPEAAPLFAALAPRYDELKGFENSVRELLRGAGFNEISTYSFVNEEFSRRCGYNLQAAIELQNPISAEERFMRSSLIPNLLTALETNARHTREIMVFECGRVFEAWNDTEALAQPCNERRMLSLGLVADDDKLFYALVGILNRIVRQVTIETMEILPEWKSAEHEDLFEEKRWMHPYRKGLLKLATKGRTDDLGVIAQVIPGAITLAGQKVVCAEIDLGRLYALRDERDFFTPVNRYPESFFEMSVIMHEHAEFSKLQRLLKNSTPQGLLRGMEILSVYQGKPLEPDEKSISVKMRFASDAGTISNEELQELQKGLMHAVTANGYRLRQ